MRQWCVQRLWDLFHVFFSTPLFSCISLQLYREDKPTCSELCVCSPGGPASCSVLQCLKASSCESRRREVTYLHNQPHYIAHRGNCTCYAGRFICEKPPHGKFFGRQGRFVVLAGAICALLWVPFGCKRYKDSIRVVSLSDRCWVTDYS